MLFRSLSVPDDPAATVIGLTCVPAKPPFNVALALPPGTELIIEGYRAKNGTNTCNASTWKLPDGRTVFAGSSGTGPEPLVAANAGAARSPGAA